MLVVGYCYGVRFERRLCEEVQLHLAYRWFCRLDLDDPVPDHSTFSVNRHGRFRDSDLLRQVFEAVVRACIDAGLVKGEGFAVDASVMEADASRYRGKDAEAIDWSLPARQTRAVAEFLTALDDEEADADRKLPKVISPVDPCSPGRRRPTSACSATDRPRSQTAGGRPFIWRKAPRIRGIKGLTSTHLTAINAAHALSADTPSMSSALVLAEQKVPRYTSYPTAPHFTAAVGPDTYGQWLAALPAAATLSLYLHVPYCKELCLYCGCHTKMVRRPEPLQAYARRLAGEIALLARTLEGRKVVHIHWGGGTPSILGPATLTELSAKIADRFDLTEIREHAIELDPRRIDPALGQALARIGFNRVSLGIQDFAPNVQEAIGRVQPFETVTRAVRMLREAGIAAMNFDLMYGLPRQTVRDVRESAWTAATLQARRIALFGYAHVPWLKPHQRLIDAVALPGAAERLEQAETARTMLLALGYQAVGFDHFALPEDDLALAARTGKLHRNFQGYTTDGADALIGLGASAIGRLPQGFAQNASAIGTYSAAIDAGRHATTKGVALSEEDRVRGRIIERFLCDLEIDLETITGDAGRLGLGGFEPELATLKPLEHQGLVQRDGGRIRVTERGRAFVRLVAAVFDVHLREGEARHSVAV